MNNPVFALSPDATTSEPPTRGEGPAATPALPRAGAGAGEGGPPLASVASDPGPAPLTTLPVYQPRTGLPVAAPAPFDLLVEGRGNTRTGALLDPPLRPASTTNPVSPASLVPVPVPVPVPVHEVGIEDEWDEEIVAVPEVEAGAAAKKSARKVSVSRAERPVAVTGRDLALLEFLGRYRMATYPQIATAFHTSQSALRHRLPRLAKQGLVARKTVGKSAGRMAHGVWLPTRSGLKLAGLDLPTPELSWVTVIHTLGLVDIGLHFEAKGETVVTEREIRAADTRNRPSERMKASMTYSGYDHLQAADEDEDGPTLLYVVPLGAGKSHYGHIPDMVLARPRAADGTPQSVAIELELNRKPPAQWRKILLAYKKSHNIGEVLYLTPSKEIHDGIIAAAKEVGAERIVVVRKFEPTHGIEPLPNM